MFLVWRNEGLDNRVGCFFLNFFIYFLMCVLFLLSKCLCLCIELNKTKKQLHNFIPLLFSVLLCWYVKMKPSVCWHIFGEIEYRNSLLFQEKSSETFLEDLKKKFRVDRTKFLGRAGYAKLFLGLTVYYLCKYQIDCAHILMRNFQYFAATFMSEM